METKHIIYQIVKVILLILTLLSTETLQASEPNWPQFRGIGGLGIAQDDESYPSKLDISQNLLWETEVPEGHSSPCIWGNNIFFTACSGKSLETICIDRGNGKIKWRKSIEPKEMEDISGSNSYASSTPVCDGEKVYVYFGSFGLLAYDMEGNELWKKFLPIPNIRYGSGASPILVNDMIVINCDSEKGSAYILAADRNTGETIWRQERQVDKPGWSTPVLWKHADELDLVVRGSGNLISYALKDGQKRWWLNNLPKGGDTVPTPVYAGETLFVTSIIGMTGDPVNPIDLPDFTELLKKYDNNNDGHLVQAEIPEELVSMYRYGPDIRGIRDHFSRYDTDKDSIISKVEWNKVVMDARNIAPKNLDTLVAISAGGTDDISRTHVKWTAHEGIGQVPSPLFYNERIYLIKHGGNVTCYDAQTGKKIYGDKTGVRAYYFASPVAADDKIYFCSLLGDVFVVQAGEEFKVLSHNKIGEDIYATPALVDGNVYLRTEKKIYAFSKTKDDSVQTPPDVVVKEVSNQSKTLYEAAADGDIELVKTLISSGADVNTPNDWGWTPLYVASGVGNRDLVNLLIDEGADVKTGTKEGMTPLHFAISNGNKDIVELLIEKSADINIKSNNSVTPLHLAASHGQKGIVELLISKGAEIDAKDNYGRTPLHLAAGEGQVDAAEILITKGAEIEARNNNGQTPLHFAARNGYENVVKLLISKGANKEAKNNGGLTPLHFAARNGYENVVKLLISKGADLNIKNNAGRTPLDLAQQDGHTEIVELLRKHGAKE